MLVRPHSDAASAPDLRNAEIPDRLASLAQFLSAQKENPYCPQTAVSFFK